MSSKIGETPHPLRRTGMVVDSTSKRLTGIAELLTLLLLFIVVVGVFRQGGPLFPRTPEAPAVSFAPSAVWVEIPENALTRQNTPEHSYVIDMTALTNEKLQNLRDASASQLRYNNAER